MMELGDWKVWCLRSALLLICVNSVLSDATCVSPGDCGSGFFCHTAEVCISCDKCRKERNNFQHCNEECDREFIKPVSVPSGYPHLIAYVCGSTAAAIIVIIVITVVVYRRHKKRATSITAVYRRHKKRATSVTAVMESLQDRQECTPTIVCTATNDQDNSLLLLKENQIV